MGWIYCWRSKTSGKRYIGQTTETIESRWYRHKKNAFEYYETYEPYQRLPLYRAMRKYGADDFELEFAYEYVDELLDDYEIFYIMYYHCITPHGYNVSPGGHGAKRCGNIYYVIDAEHRIPVMYDNSVVVRKWFNITKDNLNAAYQRIFKGKYLDCPGIIKDGRLYYVITDMDQLKDNWPCTPQEFKSLQKLGRFTVGNQFGKNGSREGKAKGGRNGRPVKYGKVVKEDTGEVLYEGSYQECQNYIGMSSHEFGRKAAECKSYKSKKLGCKVLCIPVARREFND